MVINWYHASTYTVYLHTFSVSSYSVVFIAIHMDCTSFSEESDEDHIWCNSSFISWEELFSSIFSDCNASLCSSSVLWYQKMLSSFTRVNDLMKTITDLKRRIKKPDRIQERQLSSATSFAGRLYVRYAYSMLSTLLIEVFRLYESSCAQAKPSQRNHTRFSRFTFSSSMCTRRVGWCEDLSLSKSLDFSCF